MRTDIPKLEKLLGIPSNGFSLGEVDNVTLSSVRTLKCIRIVNFNVAVLCRK